MTHSRVLACCLAMMLSGCIHTVSGPGRAARPKSVSVDGLRIIYAGQHHAQPTTFINRLATATSRELGRPVAIEHADERQFPAAMERWPSGVVETRGGEDTILIRAAEHSRCGMPAAAAIMVSAMTLGLFPFVDGDEIAWVMETYDEAGRLQRRSEFQVQWHLYGWLPLIPFKPLNMAWRAVRGGEHDYFVRTFPSHLVAELASVERRPSRTSEGQR